MQRRLVLLLALGAATPARGEGEAWFESPPVLPAVVASSDHLPQGLCRNHSREFLRQLRNYTLWAVQMFDASTKVPEGVVAGATYQMGHFDECVRASWGEVRGQYCLLELSYRPLRPHGGQAADPYLKDLPPQLHVWEKLKRTRDYTKVARDELHWALCLPASCAAEDIQAALDRELQVAGERLGLQLSARVSPRLCSVAGRDPPYSPGEITFVCVIGTLLLLLVSSTWYDLKNYPADGSKDSLDIGAGEGSLLKNALLSFSARRSLKSVLNTRVSHPATDASNGPRFLFMVLIIFGHRMTMFVGHPLDDAYILDRIFLTVSNGFILNGTLLVDSYLVISGLLLSYHLLIELDGHKGTNLALALLIRYVRLTPVYMLIVFFHATVFHRMGSGPFWEEVVGTDRDRCRENWWTNLLHVNNYVHTEGMCMFQSWYLSCDFQLCAVALVLVYSLWRWPWLGYSALALLCAASAVVPFLAVLLTRADPFLVPIAQHVRDPVDSWYFRNIYIKTHNRAAPYFIGVIVGLIMFKMRSSKFKLGKVTSHALFALLVWTLGTATMLAAFVFFDPARPYSAVEAALYASLHRVGFGAAIASYFLLIAFGQCGVYQRVFSWKPFTVLSRLTYGAYLVHTLAQLYDHGSLRAPRPTAFFSVAWMTMSDCTFAFVTAFFLLILVEAPFRAMEKVVFGRK
ncbi:nose resistant to fluoxetine protein 6-like [Bacillus rossius redtenbacheri]|uniref:nose resistant to fluoxetine protein 6-like n=1 Tax=Bacillus rossius redtenbacheri TaxID=93214 RepID=UPI002FDD178B